MKIASLVLLAGLVAMISGCTPAYTASERGAIILRSWDYDGRQAMDDMDYALLLRPASRMTIWNVR